MIGGAAAGWTALREHAARVVSWCALSLPHLASYAAGMAHADQREKAQYLERCLVPGLAEQDLSKDDPYIARSAHLLERSMMKGPYRFVEWGAGHWLAHERRGDVVRELLAHFRAVPLHAA
jgi:hypothetical protein